MSRLRPSSPVAVLLVLSLPTGALGGNNPSAKLAMHVIASEEYLDCEDLIPAACESINVDVSLEELSETNGYGCIALLAYDVEGMTGLEFALDGWPTGRGAPGLEGPYWCPGGATSYGDHLDSGGATAFKSCTEPDSNGIVLLGYFHFGPVDSSNVPIDLSFIPSTYSEPEDSLLAVTDCTVDYVADDVVASSGCTIGGEYSGTSPDCGGRLDGGMDSGGQGEGPLRLEKIWNMGEGTLGANASLPRRAIYDEGPTIVTEEGGMIYQRALGERKIVVFDEAGGIRKSIPVEGEGPRVNVSHDGSTAIIRSGAVVRCGAPLRTRVLDLGEEQILFEGKVSSYKSFHMSRSGQLVLCNVFEGPSSLLRRDLSILRQLGSMIVAWDFSDRYVATLEVDLSVSDQPGSVSDLHFPPAKGPLYLRVYNLEGEMLMEEFLDEASAGIAVKIVDDGTVVGLHRKYRDTRWVPPRTDPVSNLVLVVDNVNDPEIVRHPFTLARDTQAFQLAISHDSHFLAISGHEYRNIRVYALDSLRGGDGALDRPLRDDRVPHTLVGEPDMEILDSRGALAISTRGLVAKQVVCKEIPVQGEHEVYYRVLVLDSAGHWVAAATQPLSTYQGVFCQFFGPEDNMVLIGSTASPMTVFRIESE